MDIWFDKESLLPGQNFELAIKNAIRESNYFLAILSTNSVTKKGFIQKELIEALDVLDEFPECEIFIIPIRLEKCKTSIEKLRYIHRADMFPCWKKGLAKIFASMEIDTDLSNKTVWFYKGLDLHKHDKYSEAIECYDNAIQIDQNYLNALNSKGYALAELHRYEEAIQCYDKAILINPNHAGTWNNKGYATSGLGNHEDALKCFDEALRINPNYAAAWNTKGYALAKLDKNEEAIECYDKAIELNPNYASAWNSKGYALRKLGQYKEAELVFAEAKRIRVVSVNH